MSTANGEAPSSQSQVQRKIAARVRALLFRRPPSPDTLGRFTLLEKIGEGGMGTVHAAHDERLDRKVAIKVLRNDELPSDAARARLIREAQAMARLNHPNVLPVYDVGHDDGVVFVAMELVEGQTLHEWLGGRPRRWSEVLPRFVEAARGLQAAHEAGIVHRDFKPSNVMIDDAGRVRVMDFGLACFSDEEELQDSMPSGGPLTSSHEGSLTQTGTVLGSPYYMAPEQHLGLASDARSDQYAFCVALWQAIYGVWPFEGDELRELCEAKLHQAPAMPSDRAVPRWLHPMLLRGLAPKPDARFTSMADVLRVIEASTRRPAYGRFAAVGLGLSALVAGGLMWTGPQASACAAAGDRLHGVWDSQVAAKVEAEVGRTDLPYAEDSWTRLSELLDGYAAELSAGYVDACQATLVEDERSEAATAARIRCLDGRRDQLAGLRDALSTNGPELMPRSVLAARGLPSVASCADPAYVQATVLPVEDADESEKLAALRASLARTKALRLASDFDMAMTIAEDVRGQAEALGNAPLLAEAGHVIGDIHLDEGRFPEALETFREAYFGAAEDGQHDVKAELATHMVYVLGYRQAKYDEAEQWVKHATADIDRLGDERAHARLLNNTGLLHGGRGEHERALELYEQALEIRERLGDPEFPQIATLVNNMGIAHKNLGRADEALEAFERAVAIKEKELGAEHPDVASTLNNVAVALVMQAKYERAEGVYRKVLSITEPAFGPDHVDVARTRFNLGNLLNDQGRYDEALEAHHRALAARERAHGQYHPDVAQSLNAVGIDYLSRGEPERGLSYYRRALEVREHVFPPNHPSIGASLNNIGNILRRQGEYDEAQLLFERAAEIFEHGLGPEHPHMGIVLGNIGSVCVARQRYGEALVHYHRALTIAEKAHGSEHPDFAEVLGMIGDVYREQERWAEALEYQRRALAIVEAALGPEHVFIADRALALGFVHLDRGEPEAALEVLERAVSIGEANDGTPRVQARFALARALAGARTQPARARRLARAALDELRNDGDDETLAAEIEAWLQGPGKSRR
ncbi:MAG: tetratricopeptide repeat protein [Myxococcota bacterium]